MFRSGEAPREWLFYLDDMIEFAEKVRSYTAGLDQERFVGDSLTYDATLRNLELIGESATHVPEEVRKANPEIARRLIVATRNRLIHGYTGEAGRRRAVTRHARRGDDRHRQTDGVRLPPDPCHG